MRTSTAEEVIQLQSEGKKLLVVHTASWCKICDTLTPRLYEMSISYPDITFLDIDVEAEANKDYSWGLGVFTVPTIYIYRGDEVVNRSVGANTNEVYTKILDRL